MYDSTASVWLCSVCRLWIRLNDKVEPNSPRGNTGMLPSDNGQRGPLSELVGDICDSLTDRLRPILDFRSFLVQQRFLASDVRHAIGEDHPAGIHWKSPFHFALYAAFLVGAVSLAVGYALKCLSFYDDSVTMPLIGRIYGALPVIDAIGTLCFSYTVAFALLFVNVPPGNLTRVATYYVLSRIIWPLLLM